MCHEQSINCSLHCPIYFLLELAFDSALYLSIYGHISFQTRETKARVSEALLTQTKTVPKRPNRLIG